MSGHAAILGLMQASSDLMTLVGDRIYPDVMDDPPIYPSVTFQKIGGAGARGAVKNPGLLRDLFQVSIWSNSRLEVVRITGEVRKALDRKRKVIVDGIRVDDCFYESDWDDKDPDDDIYYNHMNFRIHYRETT